MIVLVLLKAYVVRLMVKSEYHTARCSLLWFRDSQNSLHIHEDCWIGNDWTNFEDHVVV